MIEPTIPDWWLKEVGFVHGNPFSIKEADTDPLLEPCFYEQSYFYDIKGSVDMPRTAFLVADRGCGKSTNRRILEKLCKEGRAGGLVLAVSYTEFGLLLERTKGGVYTARVHVEEIIKCATKALLDFLKIHPNCVKRLYPEGYRRLFKWFLDQTDLLSVEGLDGWLYGAGLLNTDINAQILIDIAKGKRENFLREEVSHPDGELISFLISMIEQAPAKIDQKEISHIELFRRFVDLTKWLDIKAIYILVDRLDESPEIAGDPAIGAQLLEPLVADLHLMEMPRVAFKFFIPSGIADALREKETIRIDRLTFKTISWSVDDLVRLLERRISTYSSDSLHNLEELAIPQLSTISRLLAEKAQNSPRNLLRIGEWLFYHHVRLRDGHRQINQTDLKAALDSFQEEQDLRLMSRAESTPVNVPIPQEGIFLEEKTGKVWRSSKELDSLTKYEFKLLKYLQENPGQILSHDDLVLAVYGEKTAYEFDNTRLYALIGRLRKIIGKDSNSDKEYIVTVRGQGFRFNPSGE